MSVFDGPRIALLTGAASPVDGLQDGLMSRGVAVERFAIAAPAQDFDDVLRSYLQYYDTDLSGFDGVISTAAPGFAVRHRNHVCYLTHFASDSGRAAEDGPLQAARGDIVRQLDRAALVRPSLKGCFAASQEVRERLRRLGVPDAEMLRHPSRHDVPTGDTLHVIWQPVCDRLLAALGIAR